PQDPHSARRTAGLAWLRGRAGAGAWGGAVPAGPSLRPGARSDRVVSVRNRLIALGDLSAADRTSVLEADQTEIAANAVVTDLPVHGSVGDPRRYDDAVVAAVSRFQERHGLNQDGIVGPKTRGALNADAAFRMRQIAVNLERLRWLNRDLGQRHVFVNLAAYEMALVEDGRPVFESRVVIGKARRHQTPEFSDEMEYMVVNPSWHVPASIAREEILPKLQQDPSYLSRRNMRLVGAGAPAEYIDWWGVTPSTFPGRITQGPGPGNALGKVKFMFPNRWAIYLHDTPHKSLFRRDERAYSHGCVRVHEPFEFAYHLLAPQSADPQAKFQRYLRSGRETWVHFDTHIPVHLTYRTAWVDEDGRDHFRADIYGRDAKVAAALEKAGVDLGL
ncbi:MAG: murein L,D-transpeptidase, partial [Paracoccaceae bacterium]